MLVSSMWLVARRMARAGGALALAALVIAAVSPHDAEARVGYPVWTTINQASLFQCPHAVIGNAARSCNQGVVANGRPSGRSDDVTSICRVAVPGVRSPWGGEWRLVLNRANNHVGFIDDKFLVKREAIVDKTDCRRVGNGVFTTINRASLFQCPRAVIGDPARSCNQGVVAKGRPAGRADDVAAICRLKSRSPWRHDWWLVLNHANNHVGFIDSGFVVPQRGRFTPKTC